MAMLSRKIAESRGSLDLTIFGIKDITKVLLHKSKIKMTQISDPGFTH